MPGIDYTIGMKSDDFRKGIRTSIASIQVMGQAVQFAMSKVQMVLADVVAGFASIDPAALREVDSAMADQIETAGKWAHALQNPIDALLKLKNGSTVGEAFAEVNASFDALAKQHKEQMERILAYGMKTADELAGMAKRLKAANRVLDAKDEADAAARDRRDAAAVRNGEAPEDVASRRADEDAAAAMARLQREQDASFKASQEAADNLLQANRNKERMMGWKDVKREDLDKASGAVAAAQKNFDLARAEFETVKAIHQERIRAIREEATGRKEILAGQKASRLTREQQNAAKLAEREALNKQRADERAGTLASSAGRSGAVAADRLARIGGYVGRAGEGIAAKAADRTAKATEACAMYLKTLANSGSAPRALKF